MTAINRKPLFDAVQRLRSGKAWLPAEIAVLDRAVDEMLGIAPSNPSVTARTALELVCHEAIVQEAYKDSVGVWTWSVGLTKAAGIDVLAYKDNPQSLKVCLAAYVDRLTTNYLPDVLKAFHDYPLTEAELTAALSFHYNTGAIGRADWVTSVRYGRTDEARVEFMNWKNPPEIVERREKERDLFFGGHWCNDGTSLVYPVRKPSYSPHWSLAKRVDVRPIIEELLA